MNWLFGKSKTDETKDLSTATDAELIEQELTRQDWVHYESIIEYFNKTEHAATMKKLYPDTVGRFVLAVLPKDFKDPAEREKEIKRQLRDYLLVYEKYEFDKILNSKYKIDKLSSYCETWPLFCYGYDKYGHPVYYDGSCTTDMETVCKVFEVLDYKNEEYYFDLMHYKYRFMKRLHNNKWIQSRKLKKSIQKHVMVCDVQKVQVSIRQFTGKQAYATKALIAKDAYLFPETAYRIYLINASMAFRVIWSIVSAFLSQVTNAKVSVLGPDFLEELTKQVPIDQIPPKYGGKGKWDVKLGSVADIDDSVIDEFEPIEEDEAYAFVSPNPFKKASKQQKNLNKSNSNNLNNSSNASANNADTTMSSAAGQKSASTGNDSVPNGANAAAPAGAAAAGAEDTVDEKKEE